MESPDAHHQTASHHSLRNHTGPSFYDELTREEEDENGVEATSLRSVSVRLPPKPQFQFVQDNQVLSLPLILPVKRPGAFPTSQPVPEKAGHVARCHSQPPLYQRDFPTFLVGFSSSDCNVAPIVPVWFATLHQPLCAKIG